MLSHALTFLVLPFIVLWAKRNERTILRKGSRLSTQQLADAICVGVRDPERVRILFVPRVPPRLPRFMRKLVGRCGLGPANTAGMALGHGIYVRADQYERRELLVHEFVHTAQYERLGFRGFLRRYVRECLSDGYPAGPLEAEATRIAHECVGGVQPSRG